MGNEPGDPAHGRADGGAFEGMATLVPDDGAGGGPQSGAQPTGLAVGLATGHGQCQTNCCNTRQYSC